MLHGRGFDTKEVNFEENPFISCQSSLSIKLVMDGNILCFTWYNLLYRRVIDVKGCKKEDIFIWIETKSVFKNE